MGKLIKKVLCYFFGHRFRYTMDTRYDYIFLCRRCGFMKRDKPLYTTKQVLERKASFMV